MTTGFDSMVVQLTDTTGENSGRRKISQDEYNEFQRHWVFYALQEKRYGQAFCDHFGITNATPLYHFRDENTCRRWINDNYL